jgi:hypothetical protein
MSTKNKAFWDNYAKEQKEKEHQQVLERERIDNEIKMRQAELNARHELIHQKERDKANLNWLAGFLIIGTALLILVGFAKYQNAHNQSQSKPETTECNN